MSTSGPPIIRTTVIVCLNCAGPLPQALASATGIELSTSVPSRNVVAAQAPKPAKQTLEVAEETSPWNEG